MPSYFHSTSQSAGLPIARGERSDLAFECMREKERIRLTHLVARARFLRHQFS